MIREILKLIVLLIETCHTLIDWRKSEEFDNNVKAIKDDPVAYAKRKFGKLQPNSHEKRGVHGGTSEPNRE